MDTVEASTSPEIGRQVTVGGVETNYHRQGKGAPVLLLHGSGPGVTAWANWRLTIPALGERFDVLAPDLLGFGYTGGSPNARHGMRPWLDHVLGFLDSQGLARVSVVGNSFGGAVALALACHHPQRVERLALMGSVGVPFRLTPALDKVWGYRPSLAAMQELVALFSANPALATPELAEMRYRASLRPGVQERFQAMFTEPRQQVIEAIAQPEALVAAIPHETLLLHGRDDRVIPLETSLALHRLIARSQLHTFAPCGHWTQIEQKDRFNLLLTDFLAGEL